MLSVTVSEDGPILNLHNNAQIPLASVREFVDPSVFESSEG